ncbi:winged helix-turn-helix transcriptional regulator [Streptomyces sp. FZ201]|uniref:winged helix-turn-helix transcriptional regulator n=1 Tax=Streptomyces sp. FZ201 TaxID=3057122 RepID=UPI0021C1AAE2|nr:winged helix-turn-helix transcriptional regulator [Streptomyces sp. FZ201]
MSPRRSYDQYCSAARALDVVGDRWTLLIVRELLAGPRRYTDLHADLPGVSTDVLASRLKDMERDGLTTRRRLPPPGAAYVYELTPRGRQLLPVLQTLGEWGRADLGERRPTDAVRAHWFALPLLRELEGEGLVEVTLEEGRFHVYAGAEDGPVYGDGPAPAEPDARLALDTATCTAVARGELSVPDAVRDGRITVTGDGTLAKALREG